MTAPQKVAYRLPQLHPADVVSDRPVLLDLYCCQGGAAKGYHDAGFRVIGVDIEPQPRYPYTFIQADALDLLNNLLSGLEYLPLGLTADHLAAIGASPPCQAYTNCQRIRGNEHPDLVGPTRALLQASGLPWIMENVEGAPLIDPVMLCGAMFPELRVYRHRLFESNVSLEVPDHPAHVHKLRKMGRAPQPGDFMHIVGNFSGVEQGRAAMGGVDWMSRDGLRESIPPAYTRYLGSQLMQAVAKRVAA